MAQIPRRRMIAVVSGALAAQPGYGQRMASPQPMPSPNAPQDQNVPAGLDGANIPVRNGGGRPILSANWVEIKSDAAKLLQMATDFKQRVDRTNLASTLLLAADLGARRIEKLARKSTAG